MTTQKFEKRSVSNTISYLISLKRESLKCQPATYNKYRWSNKSCRKINLKVQFENISTRLHWVWLYKLCIDRDYPRIARARVRCDSDSSSMHRGSDNSEMSLGSTKVSLLFFFHLIIEFQVYIYLTGIWEYDERENVYVLTW